LWWTEFSPYLSFFCSASTVAAYIFTSPTCKATTISLEPCALNADFQHFIPRFNQISLLYGYAWKKGLAWKEAQRQLQIVLVFTLTHPQNIYKGPCKCIWQIFTLASWKCNKNIYTLQQNKCKCKKFSLTLDLHAIYTTIDTYKDNVGLNQWWVTMMT